MWKEMINITSISAIITYCYIIKAIEAFSLLVTI